MKHGSFHHPLQSKEWEEFRKKTGVKVIRTGSFQLTVHPIPHLSLNIGYLPKGPFPNKKMVNELYRIGKENNCIFIQLEPNVVQNSEFKIQSSKLGLRTAAHPLFTKYTFVLDLSKSEDELLKNMHHKTRYNIKIAQKNGVEFVEDNSDKAFQTYLKLTEETTKRQGFYAHTKRYHELMWEALRSQTTNSKGTNKLTAHLFITKYKSEPLVAWILFVYKDTLYYPYGASSDKYREIMASNLMMWEAIRFGKKLGLKKFDMWGSTGPNPDEHDPWYGFHKFKQGYGAMLVEYVGSYDLVINSVLYELYVVADKLRWLILRLIKK